MNKAFTIIKYILFLFCIGLVIYLNLKLYSGPNMENDESTRAGAIRQLNYLEYELRNNNLGPKMQNLFPEGFVFVNALYGLTWAEVARNENNTSELFDHAKSEARFAYNEINSDFARGTFNSNLEPPFGIFYHGWKNYLLAKILEAQIEKDSTEINEFNSNCESIAAAITNNESPYLESYLGASWPADAFVAVASLKLDDEIFTVKYDTLINEWLQKVKSNLDAETKMIPHSTIPGSGKTIDGTRGSSICLTLIFLADIDPVFAQQQFNLFKEKFTITRFGLPFIREYPKGTKGRSDIDSGPVMLKVGFTGTIVSAGTFKKFGEYKIANNISGSIESLGFAKSNASEKKYLFGNLPIADAFIAWTRILESNTAIIQSKGKNTFTYASVYLFHLYCFLLILIIVLVSFRKKIKAIFVKHKLNKSLKH